MRDSIDRVPRSVNSLAPDAEFLAVIDNNGPTPCLVQYCDAQVRMIHSKSPLPKLTGFLSPRAPRELAKPLCIGCCSRQACHLEGADWAELERRFRSIPHVSESELELRRADILRYE